MWLWAEGTICNGHRPFVCLAYETSESVRAYLTPAGVTVFCPRDYCPGQSGASSALLLHLTSSQSLPLLYQNELSILGVSAKDWISSSLETFSTVILHLPLLWPSKEG